MIYQLFHGLIDFYKLSLPSHLQRILNQINFIENNFDSNSEDFELSKNGVESKESLKIQTSSDLSEKNFNFKKTDMYKAESNKKMDYVSNVMKKIKKNSIFNEKKMELEKIENDKKKEHLNNSPPPTKKMKSISSIQKTKTNFLLENNEKEGILKEKQIVERLMREAYQNFEGIDFHQGF